MYVCMWVPFSTCSTTVLGYVSVHNIDISSVTNDLDRHYGMYFDLERHCIVNCGLPYVMGILTWTDIMSCHVTIHDGDIDLDRQLPTVRQMRRSLEGGRTQCAWTSSDTYSSCHDAYYILQIFMTRISGPFGPEILALSGLGSNWSINKECDTLTF